MWIKHPHTGVVVDVRDQAHIDRLLGEGGHEVPDPTIPPQMPQEPEQAQESEVAADGSRAAEELPKPIAKISSIRSGYKARRASR